MASHLRAGREVDPKIYSLRMHHTATEVLMIEPVAFKADPETCLDNHFQHANASSAVQREALAQFKAVKMALETKGIQVHTFHDMPELNTPDSIFPNNWFSTHSQGTVCFYPMKCQARRRERRPDIVRFLTSRYLEVFDLTSAEASDQFLEGTGVLVLDHLNQIAFMNQSQRASKELAKKWCKRMKYELKIFEASDDDGISIYHTNVMLAVGKHWAIVCLEAIRNKTQRKMVADTLEKSGKEIVPITLSQLLQFCGNTLELQSADRLGTYIIVSERARSAFTEPQMEALTKHAELISVPIPTIEDVGGGGIRCMLAELF